MANRRSYQLTESTFKGSPVLSFGDSERFPTILGKVKILCVVENFERCLTFLENNGEAEVVQEIRAKFQPQVQEAEVTA